MTDNAHPVDDDSTPVFLGRERNKFTIEEVEGRSYIVTTEHNGVATHQAFTKADDFVEWFRDRDALSRVQDYDVEDRTTPFGRARRAIGIG